MIKPRKHTYAAALGSFFVLLLWVSQRSEAVAPGPGHAAAPCCPCIPNAVNYGYFPTSWRQWPGQTRPDIAFPGSIGKEVLPTPQGSEQVPAPAPTEAPGGKGKPSGTITIPFQLGPGGGLMLPGPQPKPEGNIPGLPSQPEQPSEPGQAPSTPLPGGGLPGLPSEPEGAARPEGAALPESAAPPKETKPLESAPAPEPPLPPGSVTPPKEIKPSGEASVSPSARAGKQDSHSALVGLLTNPDDAQPPALRTGREMGSSAPEPEMIVEADFGQSGSAEQPGAADIHLSEPGTKKLQLLLVPPDRTSPVKSALYVGAGLPPGDECLLAKAVQQTSYEAPDDPAAAAPSVDRQVQKQAGRPIDTPVDKHSAQQRQPRVAQAGWRPNHPPVALGGYCPVTLSQSDRWVKGNPRFSAVHQGRAYLFADAAQRECFLANPERYIPACAGYDPVLMVDENLHVTGQLDYCIAYGGRLYMFSSEATLARFRQAPQRYVTTVH